MSNYRKRRGVGLGSGTGKVVTWLLVAFLVISLVPLLFSLGDLRSELPTDEHDAVVTGDATAWIVTNDGTGNVTLMSPEGVYLIREEGKSNIKVGETAEKWLVAKDEVNGTYTLRNTNTDSRYLSYNGTGFKAYAEAREDRVIELLILPANEAAPDEGDPDEGASEYSVIPNGQYYVIAQYTDGKYYAMTGIFDAPNGCMAVTEVAVSDAVVTGDQCPLVEGEPYYLVTQHPDGYFFYDGTTDKGSFGSTTDELSAQEVYVEYVTREVIR